MAFDQPDGTVQQRKRVTVYVTSREPFCSKPVQDPITMDYIAKA